MRILVQKNNKFRYKILIIILHKNMFLHSDISGANISNLYIIHLWHFKYYLETINFTNNKIYVIIMAIYAFWNNVVFLLLKRIFALFYLWDNDQPEDIEPAVIKPQDIEPVVVEPKEEKQKMMVFNSRKRIKGSGGGWYNILWQRRRWLLFIKEMIFMLKWKYMAMLLVKQHQVKI